MSLSIEGYALAQVFRLVSYYGVKFVTRLACKAILILELYLPVYTSAGAGLQPVSFYTLAILYTCWFILS
ncbi:hypothetical protein [Pontibacter kalidii]|uniref:hypothetical protein n=1 Tax=Pontibacter kalidii TaxID=2592049 RepID=UPI0022502DFA|nr:hypothetical protein [Pontibacter kalidii]